MQISRLRSTLLLISLLLAPLPARLSAQAAETAKQAKAKELFALMHMDKTYGQAMTQVTSQTDQLIQQLLPIDTLTADQKTQVAAFKARVSAMVSESMSWSAMEPDYIKLYASTYSEEDLDGIIRFYRSPVGQSMLDKTPQLLKDSSTIAMTHMGEVEPKLKQMMDDFEQQLKAEPASKK